MRTRFFILSVLTVLWCGGAEAASQDPRLDIGPISQKDCSCISIIPSGGTLGGRALFDVTNTCGALDVQVGFAGDTARLAPKLVVSSWAKAGVIGGDAKRVSRIGTPEGWTIASISAYLLQNKSDKFLCVLGAGSPDAAKEAKRKAEEQQQQKDDEADAEGEKKADEEYSHHLMIKAKSRDSREIYLRFFSKNRNVTWPGGDNVYPLTTDNEKKFNLRCEEGEKICYGAWRSDDRTVRWGAGQLGKNGCEHCCWQCGSGEHEIVLNEGPDRPPPPPPDQVVFDVQSMDRNTVGLSFYAQNNRAWPGGDQMYTLKDSATHSFALTCVPGEKICYGAWRVNSNKYWGVGNGGKQGCTGCCQTCGNGSHHWTLNDGGDETSVASGGSDFGAIIGGLAAGAAIGARMRPAPAPIFRSSQPPIYGRPMPTHESDISGTH